MKNIHVIILLLIGLIGSTVSCQKEYMPTSDLDPVDTTVNQVGDSVYLDKIYDVYDNGAGGFDTLLVYTMQYDNLKRVTKMKATVLTQGGWHNYDIYEYFYQNSDTLPFRALARGMEESSPGVYSYNVWNKFLYYDVQGRLIKDSVPDLTATSKRVSKFSYVGNLLCADVTYTSFPNTIFSQIFDTSTLNSLGDILSSSSYEEEQGLANTLLSRSTFSYDGHLNPFVFLTSFPAHREPPTVGTLVFGHLSRQNIRTRHDTLYMPTTITNEVNINYTYNGLGLPVSGTVDNTEKHMYTYKSL